jgi:hypothetical protein
VSNSSLMPWLRLRIGNMLSGEVSNRGKPRGGRICISQCLLSLNVSPISITSSIVIRVRLGLMSALWPYVIYTVVITIGMVSV